MGGCARHWAFRSSRPVHRRRRAAWNAITAPDRLVKKLRRHGIADLETANGFLATTYWTDHNERFARAAASPDDFHVARARGLRLDSVFRLEEVRTVSNDWVARYHNRLLQLERHSGQAPARSTVVVCEDAAGALEIRYRDRAMRWTEIVAGAAPAPPVPARVAQPAAPSLPRPRVAVDHPWRQGFKHMGRDRPYWQLVDR